ncbi:MAG: ribonuclease E/G [Pseudomonadota bacterium]|nr:ribonuclease E/G [Pseudomonadota bacterium]
MTKRMLIDASHAEETRVVVMDDNRIEDFDYENSLKKQLKGNIYLARVTRVEPSLQAAFVEYGGNRHGFLAFNEIHPDYYRIPVEDREALIAEEAAAGDLEDDDAPLEEAEAAAQDATAETVAEDAEATADGEGGEDEGDQSEPEAVGGDTVDDMMRRRRKIARRYKIQEVVTRRQIMLVQVVKEERGNKGAALTTYLSLAGRYCVLMPNTARGGGVSRKITNPADRKRLKAIVGEFEVPPEMAVIVRTAGSERTKAEIKRDYEYLLRLWNQIREDTLAAEAPALVHEEASLIKRSVRDLYTRDLDEISVEGEDGYKAAKSFMRMIMPSHAKKVQPYRDGGVPLFQRHQVEAQLDAMHSPIVRLRSGGYIVINQTEALVAIDVNSGRATRERNIEETAVKTNLEAASEVARQLRLRDLAGLIVIDFIDMEERRNQNAVERRMKEAMRHDRARIQLGRISHFGLMEMSRQRLRPSLFEASSEVCPHCQGSGYVRSTESTALHILRAIEEEGLRRKAAEVVFHMASPVALYILNQKRDMLAEIEARYQFKVFLESDDSLTPPDFRVERMTPQSEEVRREVAAQLAIDVDFEPAEAGPAEGEEESRGRRRRRGGRRGDRRRDGRPEGRSEGRAEGRAETASETESEEAETRPEEAGDGELGNGEGDGNRRRRRRGRRGGRRRSRGDENTVETAENAAAEGIAEGADADAVEGADAADAPADMPAEPAEDAEGAADDAAPAVASVAAPEDSVSAPAPKRPRRSRKKAAPAAEAPVEATAEVAAEAPSEAPAAETAEAAPAKPKRTRRTVKKAAPEAKAEAATEAATTTEAEAPKAAEADAAQEAAEKPKRARRTRKKADPAPEPVSETAPEVAPEIAAEAAPAETAAAAPVVPVNIVDGEQPKGKSRRGWWNRIVS